MKKAKKEIEVTICEICEEEISDEESPFNIYTITELDDLTGEEETYLFCNLHFNPCARS